ncbi:MAG: hypothetical protein Q9202_001529 [Teloschistes flavicans]
MPSSLTTYAIPIIGTLGTLTCFVALIYGLSSYHQHLIEQEEGNRVKRYTKEDREEEEEDEESTDDEERGRNGDGEEQEDGGRMV